MNAVTFDALIVAFHRMVPAVAGIALVFGANAAGDDVDVRLGLLHGDAELEAENDVVVLVAPAPRGVGSQGQREKDVHLVHGSFRGQRNLEDFIARIDPEDRAEFPVLRADRAVVVYGVRTMQDSLHDSLARQRFSSTMLGAFAAFALLLATVGLYGVLSYLVTQSTRDIGTLVVLGARRENILTLVVDKGCNSR